MTQSDYNYPGRELELFAHAHNWKRYWSANIAPFVHGDVLEVGAGIAANTAMMMRPSVRRWVCLEPDPGLSRQLGATIRRDPRLDRCRSVEGTVSDLDPTQRFDAIIYIDVLEHIEDDQAELARAASYLNKGGHLVVLAPAHQWLYTDFDRAIGHYRRYSKRDLARLDVPGVTLRSAYYLDSVGLLASVANRAILKSPMPTRGQIRFWDRVLVRASIIIDRLIGCTVGKSVVAIWELKK